MIDDHDRCEWVNVSSGTGSPWLSQTKSRLHKMVVVVVVVTFYHLPIVIRSACV